MKRVKLISGIAMMILLIHNGAVHAYEIKTHELLNENAATHSLIDDYLSGQLRLTTGLDTEFNGKTLTKWIAEGGKFEDNGFRFFRHFHNPLDLDWGRAGLWLDSAGGFRYPSSIMWAQQAPPTQGWSWHDIRQSYYEALTETSTDKRETAFADTFRGLGQVIHLIEDASVPAHTRNDEHVFYNYETWSSEDQNQSFLGDLLDSPIYPTMSLNVSADGLVPITQLWDTNQYQGIIPFTGTSIGIAEYSNANFASNDTILTESREPGDRRYFPFPSRANLTLWTDTVDQTDPDSGEIKQVQRQYLQKIGEGETVNHFVAVSSLYWYRLRYFLENRQYLPVGLDEKCYADQAQFLVPRAVGYSAALLNYFFRGQVETKEVELNAERDRITVRLKNITPGEAMGPGQAVIVAQYTPMDGSETIYQASAEAHISTPLPTADDSAPYTFYFSSSIPADVKDLSFLLVYRGWLGAESDAVIGRVIEMGRPYVFVVQDALVTPFEPTEEVYESGISDIGKPGWTAVAVYEAKGRYWNRTQTVNGRFISRNVSDTEAVVRVTAKGAYSWRGHNFYINGVKISEFDRSGYAVWEEGDTAGPPTTWMIDGINAALFPYFSLKIQLSDGTLIEQRILTLHTLPDQTTTKDYEQWMEVDEDGEPLTWEIFYRDAHRETFTDLRVTPKSEDGLFVTLANGESLRLTLGEQFDGPFDFMEDEVVPGGGNLRDVPFLDYLPVPETLPSFVRRYPEKELDFLGGLDIGPEDYTIAWSAPQ